MTKVSAFGEGGGATHKKLAGLQAKLDDRARRLQDQASQIIELTQSLKDREAEAAQLLAVARRGAKHLAAFDELPPEHLRLHVGTRTTEANFWFQGVKSSERVLDVFGEAPDGPVLDWGCGSGRTANWLLKRPGWAHTYYGTDVDAQAIEWLRANGVERTSICSDLPPLPYEDGFFAGVFSFSVMTHIPPQNHRAWYAEIARVLRPGGRAFFTIQGDGLIATGKPLLPETMEAYQRDGFAYEVHEGHYKDAALVSPAFSRAAYAGILEEESYAVGGYANMDAFILRKS